MGPRYIVISNPLYFSILIYLFSTFIQPQTVTIKILIISFNIDKQISLMIFFWG